MNTIRLLIADDHNLFREGVLSLLRSEKHLKIVGVAEDGNALISKYFELSPDVVVSDISMPQMSGPEAARQIIAKDKNAKILFLTQHTGNDIIYSTLKSGAMGLLSKTVLKDELVLSIETVNKGEKYFVGKTEKELELIILNFENIKMKEINTTVISLTPREREALYLVGEGLPTKLIAAKMSVTPRTIESHRYRIMGKLDLKSYSQLIQYAVSYNIKKKEELIDDIS